MAASDAPRSLASAEAAMLEYLVQRDEPGALDFEAFCAGRPHLAARLRELHAGLEGVDRVLPVPRSPTSALLRRLESRDGSSRYEIRREIARGGMGVVLEVWDGDLRRKLAMKVVRAPKGGASEERLVARFLEEAQITGQLQHPGIVPVHELGLGEARRVYFTMPRVRGLEFKEVIGLAREGRDGWSLARALGVLVKVCEAVAFAHSKGVIHRDLKPSNVMVGPFGETYVMDWGLARAMGEEDAHDIRLRIDDSRVVRTERAEDSSGSPAVTMDGDVIGTPAYMSPEQARGDIAQLGPRSDVYSIGAMLYHLLTGRLPYAPDSGSISAQAVLAALLHGPPAPVRALDPEAPEDLADVCAVAMAREPEVRYESALDLARDLEAFLGSRPVAAREPSLGYALRLALRRNRAVSVTALAALLVLLVFAAGYVWQIRAAQTRTQQLSDRSLARVLASEVDELFPGIPGVVPHFESWLEQAADVLARASEGDLEVLRGLRPVIAERADLARSLPARTLEEPAEAWAEAIEAIAASPHYGGLRLRPQLGLVPLREDPDSGLWEFWLPLSGEEPENDAASGRIAMGPKTAVVLVLCPGGKIVRGESWGSATGERVDLAPFFVGKYEVTLGQWRRVMDPGHISFAALAIGLDFGAEGDVRPVDSVSWFDGMTFAARLGCTLPGEMTWEHAARAGEERKWPGGRVEGLEGRANILDKKGAAAVLVGGAAEWSDGHIVQAPVGSFEANAFGLHDVLGNVAEWCSSGWSADEDPSAPGGRAGYRGGSWYHPPDTCYFAAREAENSRALNYSRGLRLARAIDA